MRSTMVTKTYPNHQSIATGLYEPYHGIVNNEFIDPKSSKTGKDNIKPEHFDVDNSSPFWWDMNNRSVPIYIANQLYEPGVRYSGAMQWPGSIASYTDGTGTGGVEPNRTRVHYLQDYDKTMNMYRRVDLTIEWLLDPLAPANLAFIYLPEPDSTAHEYGPFSEQVKEQVRKIDQLVGYFQSRIFAEGLSHRMNAIFLSDHGMAEVRSDRVFHLEECEKKLFPGLGFRIYGVSPVFSLIADAAPSLTGGENISIIEAVRDALNSCAEKLFSGNFRVYRSEEAPKEYHYSGNRRLLDLFLIAKDGHDVIVGDNGGWKPKGYPVWGNHGYNASLPSMRPLFLAHGPRFRSGGYVHPTVFENVDLYPLMAHLLGIPVDHFPSNGSFARVRGMLSKTLYVDGDDYLRSHLAKDQQPSLEKSLKWIYCK